MNTYTLPVARLYISATYSPPLLGKTDPKMESHLFLYKCRDNLIIQNYIGKKNTRIETPQLNTTRYYYLHKTLTKLVYATKYIQKHMDSLVSIALLTGLHLKFI